MTSTSSTTLPRWGDDRQFGTSNSLPNLEWTITFDVVTDILINMRGYSRRAKTCSSCQNWSLCCFVFRKLVVVYTVCTVRLPAWIIIMRFQGRMRNMRIISIPWQKRDGADDVRLLLIRPDSAWRRRFIESLVDCFRKSRFTTFRACSLAETIVPELHMCDD